MLERRNSLPLSAATGSLTTIGGNNHPSRIGTITTNNDTPGRKRQGRTGSSAPSTTSFNPVLIFSQIATLQCFHYFILGSTLQVNSVLFGTSVTLDRIFTANYLDLWSATGWIDNGATLASSVVG